MTLRVLAGGVLFADVGGEGAPLVVTLHGWGRDRADLAPVTAGLPGTVVALDLPGFGAAPPPPEAWGAREYADVVAGALEQLVAERSPAVLLAHSFGGRVAVCLAAQRPELVAGLVLSGVPLTRREGPPPSLRYRLVRTLHRRGLVSDVRMESLRRRHGSADYANARGVMRSVLVRVVAESYEDELARLQSPVAFVWGEHDTAFPVAAAQAAAALVPAPTTFDVAAGAGHDVHHTQPGALEVRLRERCGIPA